jgi:hypothetical protein
MTQISAIMTAHREGVLSGPSIGSFREAIGYAREQGISVEPIIVLDRPDALTRTMFSETGTWGALVIETDFGDPGLARNHGISLASGHYATFLDADDLWSFNWLAAAYKFCIAAGQPVIAHSQLNIGFNCNHNFMLHVDSDCQKFDINYLQIGNHWTALSFALRDIYINFPFRKNELESGYGHDDWHWNCVTLSQGFLHQPVPDTVHMIRRRQKSQSLHADTHDAMPWLTDLVRFSRQHI